MRYLEILEQDEITGIILSQTVVTSVRFNGRIIPKDKLIMESYYAAPTA